MSGQIAAEDLEDLRREAEDGDPDAQNELGIALAELGQTEEAEALFRTAIQGGSVEAVYNLGQLLSRLGRYDEAVDTRRAAIACGELAGHKLYGMLLRRMGRNAEAAEQLRMALEHGNDDEVRLYLADVLHKESQATEPRSHRGRVIRLKHPSR